MQNSLKKLEKLAFELKKLDENIIEIFVHTNKPMDPLKFDELYLVCILNDFKMMHDFNYHTEEGTNWSIDTSEKLAPFIEELGIRSEVVIVPFNYQLFEEGEYGEYYKILYIEENYKPILELLDSQNNTE